MNITKKQQGFTIIELMIALFLGMIIMVAVGQVYLMSTRTSVAQQAGSSILDANVFGLQQIERNLRLAGLDLATKSSTSTASSGIVIDVSNIGNGTATLSGGFSNDLATRSGSDLPTATGRGGSEQLTIQYRAPTDIKDCQGNLALGPRKAKIYDEENIIGDSFVPVRGQIVVERYFLQANTDGDLELRCQAGRYALERIAEYEEALTTTEQQKAFDRVNKLAGGLPNTITVDGFNSADSAIIISNVDDFKVQLAVSDGTNIQYLSPTEYAMNNHKAKAIVAVKAAILARGNVPTVLNDLPDNPVYYMLGEEVKLKSSTKPGYIRRVYESNSMLRNSRDTK